MMTVRQATGKGGRRQAVHADRRRRRQTPYGLVVHAVVVVVVVVATSRAAAAEVMMVVVVTGDAVCTAAAAAAGVRRRLLLLLVHGGVDRSDAGLLVLLWRGKAAHEATGGGEGVGDRVSLGRRVGFVLLLLRSLALPLDGTLVLGNHAL